MPDETPETSADIPDEGGKIGFKRFSEVVKDRNGERTAHAATKSELVTTKAALDAVKASAAQDATAWQAKAATWTEERGLLQHGLTDPEAIDVARALHGRLPAEGRPALPDLVGEWRADPSKAPRSMQPWFAPAAAKAAQEPAAPPPKAATAPPPPTGNAGAAPASTGGTAAKTAAEIRAVREECQRTGDFKPFLAALGMKA